MRSPTELPPRPERGALRSTASFVAKAALTIGAFYLLLNHQVTDAEGHRSSTFSVVRGFLPDIDAGLFLRFVILATLTKLIGIFASMTRWWMLLRGQRIELPFRHVCGSFLIGRFLGTFLPSTIGLDGYKLYDAARFSGRSVEASGATLVEKVFGFTGIFLTYLVALPFGISIFGDNARHIAALTVPIALAPVVGCLVVFGWPGAPLVRWLIGRVPRGPLSGFLDRLAAAVTAYRGRPGVLFAAAGLSFVVHFTTAAMYFFTALAIGVTTAQATFWQVTFASTIQVLATVLSPFTIAGEGIREIAQYYLLSHLMGPAQAIVSAALGFWAAEAPTLFGGLIWWLRGADYTPSFARVDGRQVDYREAALAARDLGVESAPAGGDSGAIALPSRLVAGVLLGLAGGVLAGTVLGIAEGCVTFALSGPGEEKQVLWYAIALYGCVLGPLGGAIGGALALLPLSGRALERWVPTLACLATFFPLALAVTLFRLQRDVYDEQRPPITMLLLAALGVVVFAAGFAFAVWRRGARAPRAGAGTVSASGRRAVFALGGWLVVAAIGAMGTLALAPPRPASPPVRTALPENLRERPNVVLVIVDTLRADHLGAYGDRRGLSPAIDAVARDGTAYRGFAQASWTKPSIATIFTSLYASSHGAMSKTAVLPESAVTLAEALGTSGYTTAGFVSNINLAPSFNFQQGFAEYTYLAPDYLLGAEESSSRLVLYSLVRKVWFTVQKKRVVNQYYQDSRTVNAHVLPWIEAHKDDRFLLLVHYMDPHDPYFRHPYDGEAIARVENPHPSPELAPRMRELYAGEVKYMDESFAALVDTLRRAGIYDRTAVVLVADHGEEFQDHGGWWHGTTLYEEQIDVPVIVKPPRGMAAIEAPPATGARARLLDVAPTILAMTGLETPATWQGADLRGGVPADRTLFAEEDHEGNVLSAVQSGAWKLVSANPGNPRGLAPLEMFDVASDPREQRNVAGEQSTELAKLEAELDEARGAAAGQAVARSDDVKLDDATRERLRSLGYVQ